MFDSVEFLSRVLKKAGSQAAICRALDLPSSKVTLFFKPKGVNGHRRLTMEEGVKLAQVFDVPIDNRVSAERLAPVLRVVMRYAPKGALSETDVQRLAQEIAYGLELLQTIGTQHPSPDALDVAAHAIEDRFQDERG